MVDYATLGNDQSEDRIRLVNMTEAVSTDVPPTFIWHTMEDPYVPVASALNFASQLEEKWYLLNFIFIKRESMA